MSEPSRWEYEVIVAKLKMSGKLDTHALKEQLNSLGAEGWDLAATLEHLGAVFVLKRRA